jgi:sensor histidine kinase regulating citrate/malate metabolism
LRLGVGHRLLEELTTLARIKPTMAKEMRACDPIAILAHGTIGMVSVGLKAFAVVNPTYR